MRHGIGGKVTNGLVFVLVLTLGVWLAPSPLSVQTRGEDFINKKTRTNWEGLPEYWAVKDKAIIGSSEPKGLKFNTFLCSKKEFGDFDLKFKVKLEGGKGNSGVQIRSKIIDKEKFAVGGPQCDIGGGYWGSLYGEAFGGMMKQSSLEARKAVKEKDFNDYHIRAVGKKVTIRINGVICVDEEFAKMPERGIIAWQLHSGGPMTVVFKDIEFQDLSKNKKK